MAYRVLFTPLAARQLRTLRAVDRINLEGPKVLTMKLSEAQLHLPAVLKKARKAPVGLVDGHGRLIGVVAGVNEEDVDELLARTPAFRLLIARSKASLKKGAPIPAEALLAEARAEMTCKKR